MREPIDKVLATHIQRQAGHLKLTTDDSERLKAMLAHIGNQDHIFCKIKLQTATRNSGEKNRKIFIEPNLATKGTIITGGANNLKIRGPIVVVFRTKKSSYLQLFTLFPLSFAITRTSSPL